MTLNTEQKAALAAVQRGKNIFLTGAGGTGKSHTIRSIVSWAAIVGKQVAVTAMTGCAALLLNFDGRAQSAKTLHSWAGVGLGRESVQELVDAILKKHKALRRWKTTEILVVDEVSMMQADFLEKLDLVARRVRKQPTKRFGGLQLVFAGDFCQLPPVLAKSGSGFVFESALWSELIDETHNLVQIVRQADPVFQAILTEARMGALTDASIAALKARVGLSWADNEIKPTLLYSKNAQVDRINQENMASLTGERRFYEPKTVFLASSGPGLQVREKTAKTVSVSEPILQKELEHLDKEAPYEQNLELCVGAQVMLITNIDQERGLVNGARGILTGYSPGGLPLVRFIGRTDPEIIDRHNWWLGEPDDVGRAQIPLRVAYAITIHKSQGATLDSALIDIGASTFEYGQAYVALSRCKSLEALYIFKLDPMKILCHPKVRAFYETLPVHAIEGDGEEKEKESGPLDALSPAWRAVLEPFSQSLPSTLIDEATSCLPAKEDVFAALTAGECADPSKIRVVILGQDPYPTPGNAHGLAFSVRPTVTKIPASLQNIFKELAADLGPSSATSGCLSPWAEQGVLLLNDVLTVEPGKPLSHVGRGWEPITAAILATVLNAAEHVVIIAWGRNAQKKLESATIKPLLAKHKHTVLTAPHPSPLSAHTGFFGSRPFSKTNEALTARGQTPIQWIS